MVVSYIEQRHLLRYCNVKFFVICTTKKVTVKYATNFLNLYFKKASICQTLKMSSDDVAPAGYFVFREAHTVDDIFAW